jgi:[acyl-carrier-protein] S-malonyltransferase
MFRFVAGGYSRNISKQLWGLPMTTALLFPGQGSQKLGMGQELANAFPAAKSWFERVDDALSLPLSQLMWGDDEAALTDTAIAQPALLAVSLAVMAVWQQDFGLSLSQPTQPSPTQQPRVSHVAGHSLGEYSALAAAGCLDWLDAARLVRLRGQLMQQAGVSKPGAMAALLGASAEDAAQLVQQAATAGICVAANDNADGQLVLSGEVAALELAGNLARALPKVRWMPLNVSGAFHSPLMAGAADQLQQALAMVTAADPVVPVVMNVTAQPCQSAAEVKTLLVQQLCHPVRWRETLLTLHQQGVKTVIEVGSGRVLSGLAKRSGLDWQMRSAETPEEVAAVAQEFFGRG